MTFTLTPRQEEALSLSSSDSTYLLLAGGSRCVAGDTVIDGTGQTIKELASRGHPVQVLTSHGSQMAYPPFRKGRTTLLKVVTKSGKTVKVTPDHRFYTAEGWTKAEHINPLDSIAVSTPSPRELPCWRATCDDTPDPDGFVFDKVLAVTASFEEDYYTITVPHSEQYFANGILHHNSGKTALHVRNVVMRALKAPESRHAIVRYRFNHVKSAIIYDTFPKVMRMAFPSVDYNMNKTDFFAAFPNGSEIWFGGLDDKERTEKVLGNEYATIIFNECSQISYTSVETMLTRLAQLVYTNVEGTPSQALKPRAWFDENPPSKAHWSYKMFIQKIDPSTGKNLSDPDDYAFLLMNPRDNTQNLSAQYLKTLESLSPRARKRFLDGEFSDATPNQLFDELVMEKHRADSHPDLIRVVVSVDPSGSGDIDNATNDEIGILIAGLGTDGRGYVLEDCTVKAGPATWGRVATEAYDRHMGDIIVGEKNFGGAMVRHTIQTAKPNVPFKELTASRGKAVRAAPIAALYELGKVSHVGRFRELEEELTAFSTVGYLGEDSPNRADALIWALSELFPGIVKEQSGEKKKIRFRGWGR